MNYPHTLDELQEVKLKLIRIRESCTTERQHKIYSNWMKNLELRVEAVDLKSARGALIDEINTELRVRTPFMVKSKFRYQMPYCYNDQSIQRPVFYY